MAKTAKTKSKSLKSTVEKLLEEYFSLVGLDVGVEVKEGEEGLTVDLDTDEYKGLLIGHRGETLMAIQSFLGMALKSKTGDWVRVSVNVGDWREKQEGYLEELATSAAVRAKETGEPQHLYNLNAAQRRIVHMKLGDDKEVETESTGEGRERSLVVKKTK